MGFKRAFTWFTRTLPAPHGACKNKNQRNSRLRGVRALLLLVAAAQRVTDRTLHFYASGLPSAVCDSVNTNLTRAVHESLVQPTLATRTLGGAVHMYATRSRHGVAAKPHGKAKLTLVCGP